MLQEVFLTEPVFFENWAAFILLWLRNLLKINGLYGTIWFLEMPRGFFGN